MKPTVKRGKAKARVRRMRELAKSVAKRNERIARLAARQWTCPHGTTYSGSEDFLSGARNAHDELAGRTAQRHASGRSVNDIAFEIIERAPEVEPLVEEWFEITTQRLNDGMAASLELDELRRDR